MKLKINEIFYSIQGESTSAGLPTVFVRTTSCNLRCHYCDTKYSYQEGDFWTTENLISKIKTFPTLNVCVTGGEPLLQKETLTLMRSLCDQGFHVSLETSGSKSCKDVDPRVRIILDVKTPDSGAADSFCEENLKFANERTEFKFVISSMADLKWAENFCIDHQLFDHHIVLFSPAHGEFNPKNMAETLLKWGSRARLQLQLHKYIWPVDQRGV